MNLDLRDDGGGWRHYLDGRPVHCGDQLQLLVAKIVKDATLSKYLSGPTVHVPAAIKVEDALRFAAHEAALCRDRDAHEALFLLFPALMRVLQLPPMDDFEARAFRERFKRALKAE